MVDGTSGYVRPRMALNFGMNKQPLRCCSKRIVYLLNI